MTLKNLKALFFVGVFVIVLPVHSATILIEINKILLLQSKSRTTREIGISNFFGWSIPTESRITEDFFSVLNTVYPPKPFMPSIDTSGKELPQIIKEWLRNEHTSQWCQETTMNLLNDYEKKTRIKTNLPRAMAHVIFDPACFASVHDIDYDFIELVKNLAQQKDCYGNKKHKVYLTSNHNAETYEQLLLHHKELRDIVTLCDGVIISGDIKILKPSIEFYKYVFNKFSLDLDPLIICIEAEESFVKAVRSLGKMNTHCIHYKNVKKTRAELKTKNVL